MVNTILLNRASNKWLLWLLINYFFIDITYLKYIIMLNNFKYS
jgi:hypothetical protein